jgi:O-antigen/teichoic acid export membrane protein
MLARGRALLASYWTPAGRRALGSLVGLLVWTGASQLCSFGTLLLLTDRLPPSTYGSVVFGLSVQSLLSVVGTLGLAMPVVRELTQHPEAFGRTAGTYLAVVSACSLTTAGLVVPMAFLLPLTAEEQAMLILVAFGNVFACLNLTPLFDAAHRQALSAALGVPGDVLVLAAVWWLGRDGWLTMTAVAGLMVGKWALAVTLQAVAFRRVHGGQPWRVERARAKALVRSGWVVTAAGFVSMVPQQGGVVAVRVLTTDADAAVYGFAFQVVSMYLMLAWLVLRVLQPHVSGPFGLYRSFVFKLAAFAAALFTGLGLAAIGGGWALTEWWLPEVYRGAVGPLALMTAAAGLYASAAVGNLYLIRERREAAMQVSYTLGTVVYLLIVAFGRGRSPDYFAAAMLAAAATTAAAVGWNLSRGARSCGQPAGVNR